MALAASAMLVLAVRETAPGEQPPSLPGAPSARELALMAEARFWLDPALTAAGLGASGQAGALADAVRLRRESFEFFIAAADGAAVLNRLRQLPHGARILAAAERRGADPLLVAAVVETESSFDEEAVSPRGAVGLMQVMPRTAKQFGIAEVRDPARNLDAGACYLAHLLRRYDGDLVLALAAYNAGPGRVRRYDGVPPFRETRNFTERVLRRYIEHHRAARNAPHRAAAGS